ncbi:hypothetical protein [Streptomyces pseudogriseolus]|uniref:hypothetical protein n=1 Tax=Streptomyces pseudogriseolus TaxID=36817 RepID=UPI003FA1DB96
MGAGLPQPGPPQKIAYYTAYAPVDTRFRRPREVRLEYYLQPGDLVIDATGGNNTRRVVIFKEWNDTSRRACTAYGQRDVHGTSHRTLAYGLTARSQYEAHRQFPYGVWHPAGPTDAPTAFRAPGNSSSSSGDRSYSRWAVRC